MIFSFFFFNDTATTEIYTLSLHDALPISNPSGNQQKTSSSKSAFRKAFTASSCSTVRPNTAISAMSARKTDRKSTRLNSSHSQISYAVFCLKKKNIHDMLGLALGYAQDYS